MLEIGKKSFPTSHPAPYFDEKIIRPLLLEKNLPLFHFRQKRPRIVMKTSFEFFLFEDHPPMITLHPSKLWLKNVMCRGKSFCTLSVYIIMIFCFKTQKGPLALFPYWDNVLKCTYSAQSHAVKLRENQNFKISTYRCD